MRFTISTLACLLLIPDSPVLAQGGSVESFVLVDTKTGRDIQILEEGSVVDTKKHGTELSIRAEGSGIRCLNFDFREGELKRMEMAAPFYLAGKSDTEVYTANSLGMNGQHVLKACPSDCQLLQRPVRSDQEQPGCLIVNFESSNGSGGGNSGGGIWDIPTYDVAPTEADTFGYVNGELLQWHKLTIGLAGPPASEMGMTIPGAYRAPATAADYRLDVTMVHASSGEEWILPGYFVGNGNVANDGTIGGNQWNVRFTPPIQGKYTWTAHFAQGTNVAQNGGGNPGNFFDEMVGDFEIGPSDKTGDDLRAKGRIGLSNGNWVAEGTGETILKMGPDSPSNLLAYADIDNTPDNGGYLKNYAAHDIDYLMGNVTWAESKGTGLIGALNYLAASGMNVLSITTLNLGGADENVFPFVNPQPISSEPSFLQYDVSKLEQWNVVMEYAETLGIALHIKLFGDSYDMLDGGKLNEETKLYFREMIARFGHHLSIVWDLGSHDIAIADAVERSDFIKSLDPFQSPIAVSTFDATVQQALTTATSIDSVMLLSEGSVNADVTAYTEGSGFAVTSVEVATGVAPDELDATRDGFRQDTLWAALMGGAAAVQFHFKSSVDTDLEIQDFRTRATAFAQAKLAKDFLTSLPFQDLESSNNLTTDGNYCLADSLAKTIVLYKRGENVTVNVDLSTKTASATYSVSWFNPREGGAMIVKPDVQGGSIQSLTPPTPTDDWVALMVCDVGCA